MPPMDFAPLNLDQETRLRESFKRCSPETMDAILRFRNQREISSVIVVVTASSSVTSSSHPRNTGLQARHDAVG